MKKTMMQLIMAMVVLSLGLFIATNGTAAIKGAGAGLYNGVTIFGPGAVVCSSLADPPADPAGKADAKLYNGVTLFDLHTDASGRKGACVGASKDEGWSKKMHNGITVF